MNHGCGEQEGKGGNSCQLSWRLGCDRSRGRRRRARCRSRTGGGHRPPVGAGATRPALQPAAQTRPTTSVEANMGFRRS